MVIFSVALELRADREKMACILATFHWKCTKFNLQFYWCWS